MYIELSSKYVCVWGGVGVNFALLKGNNSGDPHFSFFFLKGYIIVYEIKTNFEIVNARVFKSTLHIVLY